MTTPRTVAGQAALSGMRPHVKRALVQTILAIEAEAIAPYVEALREVDRLLKYLAARDATSTWDSPVKVDVVMRAEAAHQLVRPLLAQR
jgi:hypothetical protein